MTKAESIKRASTKISALTDDKLKEETWKLKHYLKAYPYEKVANRNYDLMLAELKKRNLLN